MMNTNIYVTPITYEPKIKDFSTPSQKTVSAVNLDTSAYGGSDTVSYSVLRQNRKKRQDNLNSLYDVNTSGSSIAGGGNYFTPLYHFGTTSTLPEMGYQKYKIAYGLESNKCIPDRNL